MSYWLTSCNTKHFDIIEHFKDNKYVVFRKEGLMQNGDFVYIYLAAPYKQIKYRCKIIDNKLNAEELKEHPYAINPYASSQTYMKLELEKEFDLGILLFSELKEYGLGQVQRPSRVDGKLLQFIQGFEK